MKTTNNDEEILPLIEMIKKGDFFGIQDWINSGKPILIPKASVIQQCNMLQVMVS